MICSFRVIAAKSAVSARSLRITYDNGAPFKLVIESKYIYTDSSHAIQFLYSNFAGLSMLISSASDSRYSYSALAR